MKKSIVFLLLLAINYSFSQKKEFYVKMDSVFVQKLKPIEKKINKKYSTYSVIDSILLDSNNKNISVFFHKSLCYTFFREERVFDIQSEILKSFYPNYQDFNLEVFTNNQNIKNLIPNGYRQKIPIDTQRIYNASNENRIPIVRNISKNFIPKNGLYNKNLALAFSHGWYYEPDLNRWEWQRARLFQTVEDLYTMSYTVPFLAPMLENAGATVFMPRERSTQTKEIILDNDKKNTVLLKLGKINKWKKSASFLGFGELPIYKEKQNPFRQGTYEIIETAKTETANIQWIGKIEETDFYPVYISYSSLENSATDAHYTVFHLGGKTEFQVNQRIGGSTWIYLGCFKFGKGVLPYVELSNQSQCENAVITADAVRLGGGMGNIERNGQISGKPRFTEAARYYLQYAGAPDSLVYDNGKSEIWDDILARGNWVNYLMGKSLDSTKKFTGLNVPMDLSLAFHTDAGVTSTDSVIGILSIFDSFFNFTKFPNGTSRLASRDLADLLQTQIVEDVKSLYSNKWVRRSLWDKEYGEARVAAVPTVLLELLSHQNFADMRYGQNPKFRFDVSRAIYKAFLKFLAFQNNFFYVVQPLPVKSFQAEFSGENAVLLKWQPTLDSLESTATPTHYRVYTRIENGDFDNGILVSEPNFLHKNINKGLIYSYKITAVNEGGESFPSEVLSVCKMPEAKNTVLIVNGFDRVSAPSIVNEPNFKGFTNFNDAGVAMYYDLHFTGEQYDYNPQSAWLDDDAPGHGASHADNEGKIVLGNTFDFNILHGEAIRKNNYSFVSCSDEVFEKQDFDFSKYSIVDLLFGEEKSTKHFGEKSKIEYKIFTTEMKNAIKKVIENNGKLFISGAYIGSDLTDQADIDFAKEYLKYIFRTHHADKVGKVHSTDNEFFKGKIEYNSDFSPLIYTVEAPDAIEPADKQAKTILRYTSNSTSAGVAYKDKYAVVALSFPFETIINLNQRSELLKSILLFFEN